MRFLKLTGRVKAFLAHFDSTLLSNYKGRSLVSVVYTDSRTTVSESFVAYVNREELSIQPVFPYFAENFVGGQYCRGIFLSENEMVLVTVLSSNAYDAQLICDRVVEFIQAQT